MNVSPHRSVENGNSIHDASATSNAPQTNEIALQLVRRAAEAERAVLGCMVIERQAIDAARSQLTTADFYRGEHAAIFETICHLTDERQPVEVATVANYLQEMPALDERGYETGQTWYDRIGGETQSHLYLMNLMDAPSSAANINYYAEQVRREATRRTLQARAQEIFHLSLSDAGLDEIAASNGRFHFSELAACIVKQAEWEEPTPLSLRQVEMFPAETLPDWLRAWAVADSIAKETGIELQALLALGAVSAALTGKIEVQIKPDWTEPANLYIAPILPSGERKSPVFNAAVAPIRQWEQGRVAHRKTGIAEAETQRRIIEARRKKAESEAVTLKDQQKRDEAEDEARHYAAELAKFEMPPNGKLLVDDVTPEAFIHRLHLYGGRVAILSDEAGLFSTFAGRYNDGRTNFDAFCKAYDGSPIRNERAGRKEESYDIPRPLATVVLTPQPFILRQTDQTPALLDQGVLARFLFALPHPKAGYRTNRTPSTPQSVQNAYAENLTRLLQFSGTDRDDGANGPVTLRLAEPAGALFQDWRDEIETMLRPGGVLEDAKEWGNKLAGKTARIAGLLHMAQWAADPQNFQTEITAETIAAAIAIGRCAVSHALAAFALIGADETLNKARKILEWIEAGHINAFSRRDLQMAKPTVFREARDCDKPLQRLVAEDYLRVERPISDKPGRPAGPRYAVNPKVLNTEKPSTKFNETPRGIERGWICGTSAKRKQYRGSRVRGGNS